MLDPVSRALANSPIDDGPVTEEEEREQGSPLSCC